MGSWELHLFQIRSFQKQQNQKVKVCLWRKDKLTVCQNLSKATCISGGRQGQVSLQERPGRNIVLVPTGTGELLLEVQALMAKHHLTRLPQMKRASYKAAEHLEHHESFSVTTLATQTRGFCGLHAACSCSA